MIRSRSLILVVTLSLALGACSSNAQKSSDKDSSVSNTENIKAESYQALFAKKFPNASSKQTQFLPSDGGEFVLCVYSNTPTAEKPENAISFFVYSNKESKPVFEQSYANATVNWISSEKIQINIVPGMIKKDDMGSHGYVYNVANGQKTDLRKLNSGVDQQ